MDTVVGAALGVVAWGFDSGMVAGLGGVGCVVQATTRSDATAVATHPARVGRAVGRGRRWVCGWVGMVDGALACGFGCARAYCVESVPI